MIDIRVPRGAPAIQRFHKVSKRILDDISTVAAAFALDLTPEGRVVRLHAAYGGIAATPIRASALEAAAASRPWSRETIGALLPIAGTIGTPLSDLRGTADYRRAMVGRLLDKFFAETASQGARLLEAAR
jgi:xanthine dehydrogenase small subunit